MSWAALAGIPPADSVGQGETTSRIEVAITVDDLPSHGSPLPGVSPLSIHRQMLEGLRQHAVPQVYGFMCAGHLETQGEDIEALKAWVSAGFPLGNHTYCIPDSLGSASMRISARSKEMSLFFANSSQAQSACGRCFAIHF